MSEILSDRDWGVRLFIYQFFVQNGRPPTTAESSVEFGVSIVEARRTYHRLHRAHVILLDPGTDSVRIANPLSAVATPYQATVDGRIFYANCAWDSLGIPAMLHQDASIVACIEGHREPVRYAVSQGSLVAAPGLMVHFPLPFEQWYDDQIYT